MHAIRKHFFFGIERQKARSSTGSSLARKRETFARFAITQSRKSKRAIEYRLLSGHCRPPRECPAKVQYTARLNLSERSDVPIAGEPASLQARATGQILPMRLDHSLLFSEFRRGTLILFLPFRVFPSNGTREQWVGEQIIFRQAYKVSSSFAESWATSIIRGGKLVAIPNIEIASIHDTIGVKIPSRPSGGGRKLVGVPYIEIGSIDAPVQICISP